MQQTKELKNSKSKTNKETKNHSWIKNLFLMLIILILTGIIAVFSIFFFNIGGGKPIIGRAISKVPLVGKLVKPVIENKTPEEIKAEELQAKTNRIALEAKQLEEKEKELEEREAIIEGMEEVLELKEKEMDSKLRQLNEKLNSIYEQVEYLEKMNPVNASQILSNMESKGTVVQILRNMDKDKSSKILMIMDPLQAAQILEDIREQNRLESTKD